MAGRTGRCLYSRYNIDKPLGAKINFHCKKIIITFAE